MCLEAEAPALPGKEIPIVQEKVRSLHGLGPSRAVGRVWLPCDK